MNIEQGAGWDEVRAKMPFLMPDGACTLNAGALACRIILFHNIQQAMHRTKKFWLASGFLFLLALPAFSQTPPGEWTILPNAPVSRDVGRHEDITFVTPTIGWVVNFAGEIYNTLDGGQTWARQLVAQARTGGRVRFRSVAFANGQLGWAGSLTIGGHYLYETRDGGQTWQDITNRISGPVEGICGLWAVNDQVIYGVGRYASPARFLKSADGGQTWVSKDMSPLAGTLIDVFFLDENHGFVIGGDNANLAMAHAIVLETLDGGETWAVRHRSSEPGEWGWKISFPTPQFGYVSVERFNGAKVLKSTDGGSSWSELTIPGSRPLQGLVFANPNVGWASGRGTTSMTTDGGTTWESAPVEGNINRFRMVNDSLGYAVGEHVHKFSGSVPTTREAAPVPEAAARLGANYPNPFAASTVIAYTLRERTHVRLSIYDVLGRRVATLVDAQQPPGAHEIRWDGTAETGEAVRPGFYFYRLESGLNTQTRSMVRVTAGGR